MNLDTFRIPLSAVTELWSATEAVIIGRKLFAQNAGTAALFEYLVALRGEGFLAVNLSCGLNCEAKIIGERHLRNVD